MAELQTDDSSNIAEDDEDFRKRQSIEGHVKFVIGGSEVCDKVCGRASEVLRSATQYE
jgi:hypothetical protein